MDRGLPSVDSPTPLKESIVVGVIYRHPGHKYDVFSEKFCSLLDSLNKSKNDYYICGDININLMKYNLTENVTNYMTAISSMGCNIMIDKPTRITRSTAVIKLYCKYNL